MTAVVVVTNDVAPLVAARSDVVDSAWKLDSQRSCDAPGIPRFVSISEGTAENEPIRDGNLLGMENPSTAVYEA